MKRGHEMNHIGYDERKKIYYAALKKWGFEAQIWMVIEEMSELQKEICKVERGKRDYDALADEIADTIIMLEQLQLMFGLNNLVSQHMDAKITRLKERLNDE